MLKKTNLPIILAMMISLSLVTYSCLKVSKDTETPSSDAEYQLSATNEEVESIPCKYIPGNLTWCKNYPERKSSVYIPSKGNRPACTVEVKFDGVMCNRNGERYVSMYNLSIGSLCPELVDYFNSLSPTERAIELEKFEYEVSLQAEADFVAFFYGLYPDEDLITFATYNTVLCYTNCIESYDILGTPENPKPRTVFKITKYSCGGDACCQRKRNFTMENGVLIATEPTFTSFGESCASTTTKKCGNGGTAQKCNVECGPK